MAAPGAARPDGTAGPAVVVVGDVMTDVIVRLRADIARGSDTPSTITLAAGGSATNQAVWLAAGGAAVELVAAVGDDELGRAATAALVEAGVTPRLSVVPGATTGVVVALVHPSGERSMLTDRGANLALAPDALAAARFAPGGHLHLSGYVLLDAATRAAGRAALARARAAAMTISIDPCSAAPLAALGAERFLAWTAGSRWCCANRDEAAVLTGEQDPARAAATLAHHYDEVAVTAGAAGVYLARAGEPVVHVPATAASVVDTTGAGDAFTGTYLARRLAGVAAPTAAEAGAALAARVVAAPGARPGGLGYSRL